MRCLYNKYKGTKVFQGPAIVRKSTYLCQSGVLVSRWSLVLVKVLVYICVTKDVCKKPSHYIRGLCGGGKHVFVCNTSADNDSELGKIDETTCKGESVNIETLPPIHVYYSVKTFWIKQVWLIMTLTPAILMSIW